MGATHFGQVFSAGVPVVGGGNLPIPLLGGKYLFVSSTTGSDGNSGLDVDHPLALIDTAVGKCTDSKGDVIVVLPYHRETISAAAGIDLDVIGITVVGVGQGAARPLVTFDTAITADMDVGAADVTVINIGFSANFADITAAIDVNAVNFTMNGCHFAETAVDMNALIWIQDAAAAASDRISILGCYANVLDAANTHFINFAGTGDGHRVEGNRLLGNWGTMAIGGAGVVTFATCLDNVVYNVASDSDSCINFASTATGMCMRNLCGGAAAQANGITATAMAVAENYYGVISEDLSAILEPVAT